jgi:hypothetical protein
VASHGRDPFLKAGRKLARWAQGGNRLCATVRPDYQIGAAL